MSKHHDLPPHLEERVRRLTDKSLNPTGEFVLYWMHHAARDHENPALDTALTIGNALGKPVLVYTSLTPAIPYASDRHHTFAMEGLRDVAASFRERGIPFAFHLAKDRHNTPLEMLADAAALVVVEDFPAPPYPFVTGLLADRVSCAVWAVDAQCIVPMALIGKPYARAFQFRKKIESLVDDRLVREWPLIEPNLEAGDISLPFNPVDLGSADIPELCADSDIDHSVGPVHQTVGGSAAGYRRWRAFLEHGLSGYAKLRNNPTIEPPAGVSRLSPYLHYGHISPMTIAREATLSKAEGADKFIDELLVWRELAFNLCFHRSDVESISILPGWARDTLTKHKADPREAAYSWEQMARAQTGDPIWDAAQTSLLRHGELHNNVRMTWGKRILDWTPDPETALEILIDLNHRYALDGSDPASYGGLLWCMGLFDRPFGPERSVIGTVRPRSSSSHAKRIDLDKYQAIVRRPVTPQARRIAVVGAGMAGLAAARSLHDNGYDVQVFDKARGPGGRMATRRDGDAMFDHGAQYFTVSNPIFQRYVNSWMGDGLVSEWNARIGQVNGTTKEILEDETTRYVGSPKMSALTRYLSTDLETMYGSRVSELEWDGNHWLLRISEDAAGPFDALIMTPPAEQTTSLLEGISPLAGVAKSIVMEPCWALMATFPDPLETDHDAYFVNEGPLSWIARNSSKPGRSDLETWVAHATPEWSRANLELEKEQIASLMLPEMLGAVSARSATPERLDAHRWRYARTKDVVGQGCLWDGERRLCVAGDWVMGSRVEAAFLSGLAAAGRIMGSP